jgi:hypothetical protein
MILRDLDGDNATDVAFTVSYGSSGSVHVNFGAGDGTFGAPDVLSAANTVDGLAAGDFDGDGALDLAGDTSDGTNWVGSTLVWLRTGARSFATTALELSSDRSPHGIIAADLDGDGRTDLATTSYLNFRVAVLRNRSVP